MKTTIVAITACLGCAWLIWWYGPGVALAQPMSQNEHAPFPAAAQATRAPIFDTGGWTLINCSNVAAARNGTALTTWRSYTITCSDDSYLAWGSVTVDADSGDGVIPNGAWLRFVVSPDTKYVSCLNVNADANCKIIGLR